MSRLIQYGAAPKSGSAPPPTVPFPFTEVDVTYVAGVMTYDASLSDYFQVNLTGSAGTIGVPTNPFNTQKWILGIAQDATGSRTVSWNAIYNFPNGLPVLSTAAHVIDYFACFYRAANAKYSGSAASIDVLAQSNGF